MNHGYIKLHRKILDWEWYDNPKVLRMFIHCLLKANYKDNRWQGIDVKRGSFITSYQTLSRELSNRHHKYSTMMARTSLDHLKATGEITIKTTNKYSVITITNYDSYQDDNTQDNVKVTSKQQADNKQLTTTKKEKKENKDKNIFKEKNKKEKIIVVDYQGIADKFHTSPEIVREYEEKVQDYMDSTGKTYKNMEATIRNWMRRDQEKKTSTPKTFQRLQLEENMQYKASQTAFIEQVLAEDAEGKNKKII